jgi:hypothetical protein
MIRRVWRLSADVVRLLSIAHDSLGLCSIAAMNSLVRSRYLAAAVILAALCASPSAFAAKKLKGFYTGSGGVSSESHRVVVVEFAADGSALVEQNWVGKDPQNWNARWTQQGKVVTVTFDAVKDKTALEPLVLKIDKHDTLVPTSWDAVTMGPLAPPKLTPFGGENVQTNSVAGCQALNSRDPRQNCVTWGANHHF